jgi:putative ABC transport system permease protein
MSDSADGDSVPGDSVAGDSVRARPASEETGVSGAGVRRGPLSQRVRGMRTPRGINLWLALLTLCVVFAATAGVREALATRTEALRQTLAAAPALSSTIQVSGTWQAISSALFVPEQSTPPQLTEQQATEITDQLRGDLNQGAVRLQPASADWAALTTQLNTLLATPPGADGAAVRLEISYRQPLSQHVRLVSGAFPAAPQPAPSSKGIPEGADFYPDLQVLVTQQTAAQFHLKLGSTLKMPGPELELVGQAPPVALTVSGIVAPVAPDSAYWTSDPTPLVPALQMPPKAPPYWIAGVLAAPGESAALQADFGSQGINVQWVFPLALNELNGQLAQPLHDALTALSSTTFPLTGDVAPVDTQLSGSSGLLFPLASFIAQAQSADVLLWLLYVSLTVAGLVVLLLAGRMVVLRRAAELTLIRARGASLWRLGGAVGGAAALLCVPAAAVAAGLAVLAVPGAGGLQPDGATFSVWWPVAAVLLVAVCGPALMAVWRNRLPRRRAAARRRPRARVRPVAEVTLIAAAVAGVLILHQQGLQAGSGVNLYTSAVPVLIAIPAVIVVFRLYPLVLRGLLRGAARTPGALAFLGLARAARTALTPALPAFALVLALTVAAFAGMVRDAVTNGEVAASRRTAGADATVTPSPSAPSFTIPAAAARAIASVPGVTHSAQVYQTTWFSPSGTQVTGLAVDPAEYAALVAATEGFPAVPAGALAVPASAGAPQPVLASPAAAAALGTGTVTLTTQEQNRPLNVRIAGTLSSTPALPATPTGTASYSFIIMPLAAVKSSATPAAPVLANEILLTGPGIDRTRLTAVVHQHLNGGEISLRADVLAGLTGAPLQHGAVTVITLAVVAAAGLGLAVMLLELALGAAERELTLARLAVMGLGRRQRARVVALELLPAVIAAAVAALACAFVLPPVIRPVIDLSVFTGSATVVPLVPDVPAVVLPLAGLLVLAAVSLGIEIWAGRRRGVASSLRVGG